jgi:hypothetical protein
MDEVGTTVDFKDEKENTEELQGKKADIDESGGLNMRDKPGSMKVGKSFDKTLDNAARRTSSTGAPVSVGDPIFGMESPKDKNDKNGLAKNKTKDSSRPLSGKGQLRSLRKRASERMRKMHSTDDAMMSPEMTHKERTMPESDNVVNSKSDIVKPILRKTDSAGSHKLIQDMRNSPRRESSNSFKSDKSVNSLNNEPNATSPGTILLEDNNCDSMGKQQAASSTS